VDASLLAGVMLTARDAWPSVQFDDAAVGAFIDDRLDGADPQQFVASSPIPDLALAAACVAQEPTAHAAFDGVLVEVEFAGASMRARSDVIDDVKQMLRVQLLVPKDDKPPGLVGYRGKGPLRGWVRITATRELIRQSKKAARETPLEPDRALDDALGDHVDPALDALKAEYRNEFAEALRVAIGDLEAEDRTLLRQQIVENLSIDEVGAAFGVHRATAARWLSRARGSLVTLTHKRLAERLHVSVEEIDSVMRLVSSQLEASVVRYLKDPK
jgi:RNA polymerase sigma-70 factor (ECF subfamily)